MTSAVLPACYAVHRLSDGSWELLALDDDPYRPAWRRVVVISGAYTRPDVLASFSRSISASPGAVRNATRLRHG